MRNLSVPTLEVLAVTYSTTLCRNRILKLYEHSLDGAVFRWQCFNL